MAGRHVYEVEKIDRKSKLGGKAYAMAKQYEAILKEAKKKAKKGNPLQHIPATKKLLNSSAQELKSLGIQVKKNETNIASENEANNHTKKAVDSISIEINASLKRLERDPISFFE